MDTESTRRLTGFVTRPRKSRGLPSRADLETKRDLYERARAGLESGEVKPAPGSAREQNILAMEIKLAQVNHKLAFLNECEAPANRSTVRPPPPSRAPRRGHVGVTRRPAAKRAASASRGSPDDDPHEQHPALAGPSPRFSRPWRNVDELVADARRALEALTGGGT